MVTSVKSFFPLAVMSASNVYDLNSATTLHVFGVANSSITFASPQAEYLPAPPSTTDTLQSIYTIAYPRYATDRYFYLALVPRVLDFSGPIFGCLAPSAITFERATDKSGHAIGYRLPVEQQRAWDHCEHIILEVQRRLLARAHLSYLEMTVPTAPYSFGYTSVWVTQVKLRQQLTMAVLAFAARLALVSYLLLKEETLNRSTWDDLSSGDSPLPMNIANTLRLSWLGDWSVPRVGAFVDIGRTLCPSASHQWNENIPLFLSKGTCIPLWFAYEDTDSSLSPTTTPISKAVYDAFYPPAIWRELLSFHAQRTFNLETEDTPLRFTPWNFCYTIISLMRGTPPTSIILRRRKTFSSLYQLTIHDSQPIATLTNTHCPSHIAVFLQSIQFLHRQHIGEDYAQFMQRNLGEQADILSRESTEERQARVAREAFHANQPVPEGCPPAVYLWTDHPSLGIALRTRVPQHEINALWERTSPSMRFYNSYRDEYDIYEHVNEHVNPTQERSPTPDLTVHGLVTDDSNDDSTFDSTLGSVSSVSGNPPSTEELEDSFAALTCPLPVYAVDPPQTMEALHLRYGFVYTCTSTRTSRLTPPDKRIHVLRRLGSWREHDEFGEDLLNALEAFITTFTAGNLPANDTFDLIMDSPPIPTSSVFRTVHLHSPMFYYSPLGLAFPAAGSNTHFLTKFAYAVHFAHRGTFDNSLTSLVVGFTLHGIPFDIFWPTPITTPLMRQIPNHLLLAGRPIGMGILPHGKHVGPAEYSAYESTRHAALLGELGVAALSCGGLLWRFAVASRGCVVPVQEITCYPEETALLTRLNVVEGSLMGHRVLSVQDEYLLSGVYRVLTVQSEGSGKGSTTPDGSLVSWWPLQERWNESGLNVGYWSQQAEAWFQKRSQLIRTGHAKPLSNRQWGKELRHIVGSRTSFFDEHEAISKSVVL